MDKSSTNISDGIRILFRSDCFLYTCICLYMYLFICVLNTCLGKWKLGAANLHIASTYIVQMGFWLYYKIFSFEFDQYPSQLGDMCVCVCRRVRERSNCVLKFSYLFIYFIQLAGVYCAHCT